MAFSLRKYANLVSITLKQPKRSARIPKASDLVHVHFGAEANAGNYNVELYRRQDVRDILRVYETLYQDHRAITNPWEHGWQIIAKPGKPNWDRLVDAGKINFYDEVHKAGDRYDSEILPAAKAKNGALFAEAVYLSAEQWIESWQLVEGVRPVPESGDLRHTLGQKEIDRVKEELGDLHRDAVKDVYGRLHELVSDSATALSRYGNVPKAQLPEATVQTNLADFVAALGGLNLPGADGKKDATLTALATEITNAVLVPNFEDLKSDKGARDEAAGKVAKIADKLAGLV